ncbi:flavodoxin domain-containing protein [Occallatibacter savannae]|uniref:flavodoxin domain-containing protein n=1 Tax=Occallatibacter savannae TaxID=1002691 RepID=UPI0013A5A3AF|nr:flavodoxin domain-containing protein [Occallatibacter savannae]
MRTQVLIAYCTRSGSTAEVAEAIGKTLRETGLVVEVKSIAEVDAIAPGTEVVLGAALYIGHLPKEFHQFLNRFEAELGKVRPWVFVLGPTERERKQFAAAEEQARKELGKHPSLHPADMRVLGGKFDPASLKLAFPMKLIMKVPGNPLRKVPATDIRDWEWIHRWAGAIAEEIAARMCVSPMIR